MAGVTKKKSRAGARKADYHHGDLKRALMNAAGELLEEVGFESFTLRKCAARAGVSPSAPAHHFRDAAGLLSSLAVEGFGALSPILRAAFEDSQHGGQSPCRAVAMAYLRFAQANPALYKVMFASKLDADYPDLKAASEMCFSDLEASVTKLFPQKNQSEVRAVSLRMWASVHGLSMLLIENRLNFLLGTEVYEDVAALEAEWLAAQAVSIR